MAGYLNDKKGSESAVADGAFVTDDMASIDEDGFATFGDRAGRWAGKSLAWARFEDQLHELAGLADLTFVAAGTGENIVVFHKPYNDLEWLLKKLVELGLPAASFRRVDAFPLLPSGQIDLRKLQDAAARPA